MPQMAGDGDRNLINGVFHLTHGLNSLAVRKMKMSLSPLSDRKGISVLTFGVFYCLLLRQCLSWNSWTVFMPDYEVNLDFFFMSHVPVLEVLCIHNCELSPFLMPTDVFVCLFVCLQMGSWMCFSTTSCSRRSRCGPRLES